MPRVPELMAALRVMEATREETALLVGLLDAPRGRLLAETESHPPAAYDVPEVTVGDLLRAMRLRNGFTQAGLAVRLRVNRAAILRWEGGHNAIGGEHFEGLCMALKALPEEREALLEHRLVMPTWTASEWRKVSIEEAADLWAAMQFPAAFVTRSGDEKASLVELHVLAMLQHLKLRCARNPESERLIARVETDYAIWLRLQGRRGEPKGRVLRALRIAHQENERTCRP